jgi:hypothetical protein
LHYPSMDAGFDYGRGEEKEVKDKLNQRTAKSKIGNSAGSGAGWFAITFLSPWF